VPAAVDQLPLGPLETNCYLVRADRGASEALIVDPSGPATDIRLALASRGARCVAILVTHKVPKAFPVMARPELATMPQVEVARTGSSVLLCDKQHDGPHLWPNGDEVL